MTTTNFSIALDRIARIRRNINCVTYEEQDGTVVFALIYRLSKNSYVFLRSPSSMILLHVDNHYPLVIGYADNREQFAIAIYEHLTNSTI